MDDYFSEITITIKIPDQFKLLRGEKMKILTDQFRKLLRKFLDDHGYSKDGFIIEISNN